MGAVFLFGEKERSNSSTARVTPVTSIAVSPTYTPTPQKDLGSSGSSYLDSKGVYSVLYPNDYVLDAQDLDHVRIYKTGNTERPQSEMSDGALVVFESVDLQGKSLEVLVDTRIKEATADGTSEIIDAKKAIVMNTYTGFRYTLRGLGISQNIILQKDVSSPYALVITYAVSDPEKKGYQQEVDAVLSTLKLVK